MKCIPSGSLIPSEYSLVGRVLETGFMLASPFSEGAADVGGYRRVAMHASCSRDVRCCEVKTGVGYVRKNMAEVFVRTNRWQHQFELAHLVRLFGGQRPLMAVLPDRIDGNIHCECKYHEGKGCGDTER